MAVFNKVKDSLTYDDIAFIIVGVIEKNTNLSEALTHALAMDMMIKITEGDNSQKEVRDRMIKAVKVNYSNVKEFGLYTRKDEELYNNESESEPEDPK